jgi:hypothetical protein
MEATSEIQPREFEIDIGPAGPRPGPASPFPYGPRRPGREPPIPDRSPPGPAGLVLFDLLALPGEESEVRSA